MKKHLYNEEKRIMGQENLKPPYRGRREDAEKKEKVMENLTPPFNPAPLPQEK